MDFKVGDKVKIRIEGQDYNKDILEAIERNNEFTIGSISSVGRIGLNEIGYTWIKSDLELIEEVEKFKLHDKVKIIGNLNNFDPYIRKLSESNCLVISDIGKLFGNTVYYFNYTNHYALEEDIELIKKIPVSKVNTDAFIKNFHNKILECDGLGQLTFGQLKEMDVILNELIDNLNRNQI